MNAGEITIGSRGSRLALAQAKLVQKAFARHGRASRIQIIETEGDRRAPDTAWGEGAFVAAIERALLAGRVDVAVHSAKDIPTEQDPRLRVASYLPRDDPRDALVVRGDDKERRLTDLPSGCRVGTDSPRRTGFLLAQRPDLDVHPLHGNVDTRLRRLDAGETDALVLACAGLDRMGLGDRIAERLEPEIVPPAPGQGAIAVQVRSEDERMVAVAAAVDDRPTRMAVEAERAFLRASGGGCRAPIGALATVLGDELDLLGGYTDPDGTRNAIAHRQGPAESGEDLGRALAVELLGQVGARATAGAGAGAGAAGVEPRRSIARRVLITRAVDQAGALMSALRDVGLEPVPIPAIEIVLDPPRPGDVDAAAGRLPTYRWVVITSANGARAILESAGRTMSELRGPSWAAIGPATRRILEDQAIKVAFQPSHSTGIAMAVDLPVVAGDRILVVRGDLPDEELAIALRARGAEVDDLIAYQTREAPEASRGLLGKATADGPIAAVMFTSASTVRGLLSLGKAESIDPRSFPAVCIGPETADEARMAGFRILAVSPRPDPAALAAATNAALGLDPQETP